MSPKFWIVAAGLFALGGLSWNYRYLARLRALAEKDREQDAGASPSGRLHEAVFQKRQAIFRLLARDMDVLLQDCRLEVRHIMSRQLTTVPLNATAEEVRRIMEEKKLRHVLVTDGGRLAGIISDRDLAKRDAANARQLATLDPITVTPDTLVNPAITQLIRRRISCLPVVDGEELVGVITTTDLLLTLQCALQVLKRVAGEVQETIAADERAATDGARNHAGPPTTALGADVPEWTVPTPGSPVAS